MVVHHRFHLRRLLRVLRRCHRSVAYPAQSQEGEESTEKSVQAPEGGSCFCLDSLQDSTGGLELHPPTRLLLVGVLHGDDCLGVGVHGILRTPIGTPHAHRCGPHVLSDVEVGEHIQGMSILVLVPPVATYTRWVLAYALAVSWPYCLDTLDTSSSPLSALAVDPEVHLQRQGTPFYGVVDAT